MVGAGIVAAFQIGKVPAALPVLRAELGIDLVTAGWILSIFNVVGAAIGILAGATADKLGHRRLVLFGLWAVAIGSALGGLAPGVTTLLLSRFLAGFGFITIIVAAPGLIVRSARPEDMGMAFGFWGTYMPLGTAAMIVASPTLIAALGWRGLWEINAGLVAAYAIALAAATRNLGGRPPPDTAGPRHLARDIRTTLFAPGPLLLTLCFMTYTSNFIAVMGFLPTFLVETRGMGAGLAASITALAVVVNAAGNLTAGWLLRHGVRRSLLITVASATMAVTAIGIYSEAVPDGARVVLCIVFSVVGGLLPASILGATADFTPRPALIGTTNGLVMQGSNIGQMMGPPIAGALVAATGTWSAAPIPVVFSAAVGIVLALMIGRLKPPMHS